MLLIKDLVKAKIPKVPLATACELCLPADYEVSLVFVDNKKSHELNLTYRNKDKPTNILSFPLDEKSGEIFIDWPYTVAEAKKLDRELGEYLLFLFIHGLLHLNGMTHGSKMEREERKVLDQIYGQKTNHRARRGNSRDSDSRHRTSKRK